MKKHWYNLLLLSGIAIFATAHYLGDDNGQVSVKQYNFTGKNNYQYTPKYPFHKKLASYSQYGNWFLDTCIFCKTDSAKLNNINVYGYEITNQTKKYLIVPVKINTTYEVATSTTPASGYMLTVMPTIKYNTQTDYYLLAPNESMQGIQFSNYGLKSFEVLPQQATEVSQKWVAGLEAAVNGDINQMVKYSKDSTAKPATPALALAIQNAKLQDDLKSKIKITKCKIESATEYDYGAGAMATVNKINLKLENNTGVDIVAVVEIGYPSATAFNKAKMIVTGSTIINFSSKNKTVETQLKDFISKAGKADKKELKDLMIIVSQVKLP